MKDLKFNLTEDIQEVDGAIHYLEKIIKHLKEENKLSTNILGEIEAFYADTIIPYMEYYYINGKEIDDHYTRITVNEILDLANTLNNLF